MIPITSLNGSCLTPADISQMIAGAQSATVANSGNAMMMFFAAGAVMGIIIGYLVCKVRMQND